jgi:hypothetical protein
MYAGMRVCKERSKRGDIEHAKSQSTHLLELTLDPEFKKLFEHVKETSLRMKQVL